MTKNIRGPLALALSPAVSVYHHTLRAFLPVIYKKVPDWLYQGKYFNFVDLINIICKIILMDTNHSNDHS